MFLSLFNRQKLRDYLVPGIAHLSEQKYFSFLIVLDHLKDLSFKEKIINLTLLYRMLLSLKMFIGRIKQFQQDNY
jgi:hypothetical protein